MISEENRKKAELIADEARNSISNYCINDCHAYCCRKGYLVVNKEDIDTVAQGKTKELIEKGQLEENKQGKMALFLGATEKGCPSLKDNMCTIYTDGHRPKVCGDFPLFLEKDHVRESPRCLAVKNNLLYPYVKQITMLGFKPMQADEFADIELFNVKLINKKDN